MKTLKRLLCLGASVAMVLSLALMTSCEKKVIYPNDVYIEFPVPEAVTLSWWYAYDDSYYTGDFSTLEEHPFMKEMQQKSNVTIEIVTPTTDNASNELMTLMASGDMTDMVTHNWYTPSYEGNTIDSVIDEEIYQRLNEFVDVQMPNFNAMREQYSVIDKIVVTQQNNIIWIPRVNHMEDYLNERQTSGLVVRKDYLDEIQFQSEAGGDLPVTLADWENMLAGFKSLGVQNPLGQNLGFWCTFTGDVFLTAWDVKVETYRDPETDKVAYGAISEGFHEYVKMMNKWVNEGWLVNVSLTEELKVGDLVVGSWYGSADEVANLKSVAIDPNFELVGVPDPVLEVGNKIVMRDSYRPVGCKALDSVFISYQCENGPLACRWLDEFFTEEAYMRTSYGIEGEDYTVDAEGKVTFTDKITANADGIRYGIYQNAFMESLFRDPYVIMDYAYDQNTLDAIAEWSKSSCEFSFIDRLCLTYTEEELETLEVTEGLWMPVANTSRAMVLGDEPLENWDQYVATVNEGGVQEYTAVMQSAWDRFLAN